MGLELHLSGKAEMGGSIAGELAPGKRRPPGRGHSVYHGTREEPERKTTETVACQAWATGSASVTAGR